MKKKQFMGIMLLAQASLASAATVYTDETTFRTYLNPAYYLEEFSNFTYGDPLNGSQLTYDSVSVNGYSWTASTISNRPDTDPSGLYSLTRAISTNTAEDLLTITFTGSPVTALGGIFASTDSAGDVVQQTVTVNLSDNTSVSFLGSAFRGFTSNSAIASLTIGADQNNAFFWPKLEHFYVGSAVAPVPIPAAFWLFGSGLLGLFSLKRRSNIS